jgi:hypothetical protein
MIASKTNSQMYKEIEALYEKYNSLDYKIISGVFALEKRSKIEIKNLREYITAVTLMCGQDILKARLKKDTAKEKLEIKKHESRCNLMSILNEAIDSELCSR